MARVGLEMAREDFVFDLHPPPVKRSHASNPSRSWNTSGPPRFFGYFFGPRSKVFEKH